MNRKLNNIQDVTDDRDDADLDKRDAHRHTRRNPRLVFNDPDKFFTDLLMEQQEQS